MPTWMTDMKKFIAALCAVFLVLTPTMVDAKGFSAGRSFSAPSAATGGFFSSFMGSLGGSFLGNWLFSSTHQDPPKDKSVEEKKAQ